MGGWWRPGRPLASPLTARPARGRSAHDRRAEAKGLQHLRSGRAGQPAGVRHRAGRLVRGDRRLPERGPGRRLAAGPGGGRAGLGPDDPHRYPATARPRPVGLVDAAELRAANRTDLPGLPGRRLAGRAGEPVRTAGQVVRLTRGGGRMDFELSEEHRAIQEAASAFAAAELAPHSARWDEDRLFPVDVLRKAAELGFAGIYTSE